MDYTTSELVKSALHIESTGDDTLIARFVTAASRAIDRYCAGTQNSGSDDYFALETVTDEILRGVVDEEGTLHLWPHKSQIASVSALSYRWTPIADYTDAVITRVIADGNAVLAYESITLRGRPWAKISYVGGLAADVASLPADFVEVATVLAGRYYREAQTSLDDTIGVTDIGTLIYTKAMPQRIKMMLQPYMRVVPW